MTRPLMTATGYRVGSMRLPCEVGEAPHKWGEWKTIVTAAGRITQRTCRECGLLQCGDYDPMGK